MHLCMCMSLWRLTSGIFLSPLYFRDCFSLNLEVSGFATLACQQLPAELLPSSSAHSTGVADKRYHTWFLCGFTLPDKYFPSPQSLSFSLFLSPSFPPLTLLLSYLLRTLYVNQVGPILTEISLSLFSRLGLKPGPPVLDPLLMSLKPSSFSVLSSEVETSMVLSLSLPSPHSQGLPSWLQITSYILFLSVPNLTCQASICRWTVESPVHYLTVTLGGGRLESAMLNTQPLS